MTAGRSDIRPIVLLLLALAGLVVLACGRSEAVANNDGNEAFYNEDYEQAQQQYEVAQSESPEIPEPVYNSANVYYRNSDYQSASSNLQRALLEADAELAQSGLFNQGNTFFKTEEMERAIEFYKEVLRRDPDDQDAKHNLELALKELEQGPNEGRTAPEEETPEDGDQPSGGEQPGEDQGDGEGQEGERGGEDESDRGSSDQSDEPGDDQPPDQEDPDPTSGQGGLDEEQARRLLESVGQGTETLQGHLQRIFVSPEDEPDQDW